MMFGLSQQKRFSAKPPYANKPLHECTLVQHPPYLPVLALIISLSVSIVISRLYMFNFLKLLLYCPNCHACFLLCAFFAPLNCFHHRQISSLPIVDLAQIHPCSLKCLVAILPPNLGAHQPPPLTSPMACTLSQEEVCPKVQEWDTLVGQPLVSRCRATQTPQEPILPCLAILKHPHPTHPCPDTVEAMEEVHLLFQLSMYSKLTQLNN